MTTPSCSFILTGFGPFRGVPDNPTNALVRRIAKEIVTTSSTTSSSTTTTTTTTTIENNASPSTTTFSSPPSSLKSRNIHIIETHILETSAMAVQKEVAAIYNPTPTPSSAQIVVLHLGVNYRGKQFQLEQCAYNDATFRVPDERGYQPNGVCVLGDTAYLDGDDSATTTTTNTNTNTDTNETTTVSAGNDENPGHDTSKNVAKNSMHKFGKCFKTTLDIDKICKELKRKKTQSVVVSKDPGRFVCNYTYCLSLEKCCSMKEELNRNNKSLKKAVTKEEDGGENDGEKKQGVGAISVSFDVVPKALFVHIPPFEVVPEEEQYEFILDIMEVIQEQFATAS